MGLSSEIDINVVQRYSYLVEKLLRTTYNALGFKLTGTLQVCKSLIGNRYWIGVVDDYSRSSWSFFTKKKSQLPNKMDEIFEKMTPSGTLVKYIRCDNTGQH